MASNRLIPFLIAGGIGVVSGIYIWDKPLQEVTGKTPSSVPITDGRSQSAKAAAEGSSDASPSAHPHTALRVGGASPVSPTAPTVAGTSAASKKSYSVDQDVKTHDGSGKGGVGVSEMRERKMQGQGLPSKQGGDSPAQAVDAVAYEGEGGGIKKPKNGRWWLGGW